MLRLMGSENELQHVKQAVVGRPGMVRARPKQVLEQLEALVVVEDAASVVT